MASALLTRTLARRSLANSLGLSKVMVPSQKWIGSIRLTSYFTPAHEYIKVDGDIGTVGISDFAQKSLGDIVFVDLPEVGDEFDKGDSFGSVESVKAASDVYAPISGTVVEINTTLSDDPGVVNAEAEGSAWFIKLQIKDPSELETLMGQDAYEEHCAREAH